MLLATPSCLQTPVVPPASASPAVSGSRSQCCSTHASGVLLLRGQAHYELPECGAADPNRDESFAVSRMTTRVWCRQLQMWCAHSIVKVAD